MALLILVGRRSVSHSPMRCDLVTWQSIKEWHRLGLGSSLVFWVVETVDVVITSYWLGLVLNSYGMILLEKDQDCFIYFHFTIWEIWRQNLKPMECLTLYLNLKYQNHDGVLHGSRQRCIRGVFGISLWFSRYDLGNHQIITVSNFVTWEVISLVNRWPVQVKSL